MRTPTPSAGSRNRPRTAATAVARTSGTGRGCCTPPGSAGSPPRPRSTTGGAGTASSHPAHPLARGRPDRPGDGRGGWAATRTWSTRPGSRTTSVTRRSGTTARTRWTRSAQPCGGFEGNAQTLRVLTRLEAKVVGPTVLGRAEPHPGHPRRDVQVPVAARPGGASSGCTPTTPRSSPGCAAACAAAERRCLEAQVMDWADDVAYSVHDVEDGVHGGFVGLRPLRPTPTSGPRCARTWPAVTPPSQPATCASVLDELLADPVVRPGGRLRRRPRRAGRAQAADERPDRTVRAAAAVGATRRRTGRRRCAGTTPT